MKVLSVLESAYRATLEEQDDTIIWMSHAMRDAKADLSILLRGNAVNYVVAGQDASGLVVGGWQQTQPPRLAEDVAGLIDKGVPVFAVAEDLDERGLAAVETIAGVTRVGAGELAELFARYDQIWHW